MRPSKDYVMKFVLNIGKDPINKVSQHRKTRIPSYTGNLKYPNI